MINNNRPISKLSVLNKVLESIESQQLKEFLSTNSILSEFQSAFRKQHNTSTAALKVLNDFIEFLDNKQHCAALFVDLSKAFDAFGVKGFRHSRTIRLSSNMNTEKCKLTVSD